MLCDVCKKNEATIHIQEIVNNQKKSLHLCSSCAAAKQQAEGMDFGPFNLADLSYKLSGAADSAAENSAGSSQLVCPECNWDETRLKNSGRVGCENCYRVFAPILSEVIKNMHRGTQHVGKHPAGKGTDICVWHSEMARLQRRLQQAVAAEDYESAAEYRDLINELKKLCENAASEQSGSEDA